MGIPCRKEKNVVKRLESLKKIIVLWLSFAGLLLQTGIYAYIWMEYYYPIISKFTLRLKFNQNGHLAMFAIYFVLLFFFDSTYGGLKIGYLKPMAGTEVFPGSNSCAAPDRPCLEPDL